MQINNVDKVQLHNQVHGRKHDTGTSRYIIIHVVVYYSGPFQCATFLDTRPFSLFRWRPKINGDQNPTKMGVKEINLVRGRGGGGVKKAQLASKRGQKRQAYTS